MLHVKHEEIRCGKQKEEKSKIIYEARAYIVIFSKLACAGSGNWCVIVNQNSFESGWDKNKWEKYAELIQFFNFWACSCNCVTFFLHMWGKCFSVSKVLQHFKYFWIVYKAMLRNSVLQVKYLKVATGHYQIITFILFDLNSFPRKCSPLLLKCFISIYFGCCNKVN